VLWTELVQFKAYSYFPTLPYLSFFFPVFFPSGDRLASIVFLFETGLLPNRETTRLLAYRFSVFLATA
jgi:hypothetical protein